MIEVRAGMVLFSAAARVVLLCLASGCVVSTGPEGTPRRGDQELHVDAGAGCHEHTVLILEGVTCPSCREVIVANLLALEGVVTAQVSLAPPRADVIYCDSLDPEDLVRAVEDAGYAAHVD